MNSSIVRWLLDLKTIPQDAQGLRLTWEHPWDGWVWALIVIAAAGFAIWSYSRLVGSGRGRAILAGARFIILILLAVLISGPALELPRETIEQDWVVVLADRSASMTIADAESSSGRATRDQQLQSVIRDHAAMWGKLDTERHLVWLGFHGGAFDLGTDKEGGTGVPAVRDAHTSGTPGLDLHLPDLGDATGRRTNLNTAIDQALQRASARPLSGVVIISDGRTSDPPSHATLRRLEADGVKVFVVPLGSPEPLGDLAIRRVDAPRTAFIRDRVPVVVDVERLGAVARDPGAKVKLLDSITGEVLDSIDLPDVDAPDQTVTLTAEPQIAGQATWQVVVESEQPDLIAENNLKPFSIELVDRPLRVLYIDGYPRWEYRYVKNLLIREKSLQSSIILLSADRDFAQEGNLPITRIPRSADELAQFDVIILGDLPSGSLSPDQRQLIHDHIADRGAGLLWMGGERYTPTTYAGTVLADLLPMRGSLALPPIGQPVNMQPTLLADRLGVLRLELAGNVGWPTELSDPSYGWSRLFYAQLIEPGRLKPTAEVLAQTVAPLNGSPMPLVINMRFGSGQVIYVATDEIWRWRFGRGEKLPEQFWMQMVRMLGRESLAGAGDAALLEVVPRRLSAGQPLRVELRLLDAKLLDTRRPSVKAVLESADGQKIADLELRREEGEDDRYAATYVTDATGMLQVRLDDPSFSDMELSAPVEVIQPDDELRRPETDHPLLASLASETKGEVLTNAGLEQLPSKLPKRSITTVNPLTEPIWDTPLAFGLVLLCLTFEWIGRKVLRLV